MIVGKDIYICDHFKKKDKTGEGKGQKKCDGCGKMKDATECTKTADAKCLWKDCTK